VVVQNSGLCKWNHQKTTLSLRHYLCNWSTSDISMFGYIDVNWPKELTPHVWHFSPETRCIYVYTFTDIKLSWKQQSLYIFLECKLHWVFVHIFHFLASTMLIYMLLSNSHTCKPYILPLKHYNDHLDNGLDGLSCERRITGSWVLPAVVYVVGYNLWLIEDVHQGCETLSWDVVLTMVLKSWSSV
jgi:hypothetical protein